MGSYWSGLMHQYALSCGQPLWPEEALGPRKSDAIDINEQH